MTIKINLDKAKQIGHDIRRKLREEEFKPLDEIIMKQIPGNDATIVESKRQEIRDKYTSVQTNIDNAVTPEEIKIALGL